VTGSFLSMTSFIEDILFASSLRLLSFPRVTPKRVTKSSQTVQNRGNAYTGGTGNGVYCSSVHGSAKQRSI
jgi:hypothetical protein